MLDLPGSNKIAVWKFLLASCSIITDYGRNDQVSEREQWEDQETALHLLLWGRGRGRGQGAGGLLHGSVGLIIGNVNFKKMLHHHGLC